MQRDKLRGMIGGLGMALVFFLASSTPVRGDYTPPSQASSLVGEFFGFMGDFGSWNARHDNLPLEFLVMVPSAQEGEAVLLLFWMWLHDPHGTAGGNGSPSSMTGLTSLSNLLPPSTVPSGSPIGTIVMDNSTQGSSTSPSDGAVSNSSPGVPSNGSSSSPQGGGDNSPANGTNSGNSTGNSPPSPVSNGGTSVPPAGGSGSVDDPPPGGSNGGPSGPPVNVTSVGLIPPSSPSNGGGYVSPGSGGNTGGNNGSSSGGVDPFSGNPSPGGGGADPFVSVPEPASFMLLSIGGVGLLVGWRTRSRKS